jgi:hypothetical protein
MEKEKKNAKTEKIELVFGIVIAGIFSFVINIFSDLYFAYFINNDEIHISHNQTIVLSLLVLLTIALLQFIIFDYKNESKLDISFFKRFINFFFEDFKATKIINNLGKFILVSFLYIFLIIFIFRFFA